MFKPKSPAARAAGLVIIGFEEEREGPDPEGLGLV
jgi:hypothetical protein